MAVVTEIDVKGDSLLLWEWHSHGYDCTHACCVGFGLTGTDVFVGFKNTSQQGFFFQIPQVGVLARILSIN
jgi:hypothetical protein